MIEGKFDVVFRGQTVKSHEVSEVKANLAKLFKSTPEAIERLFTGSEVIIRRDLDYGAAMKYQSALKNAGALALIKEIESSPEEIPTKAPETQTQTTKRADNVQVKQTEESHSADSAKVEQVAQTGSEELTVAEAGAQILPDKIYEKREVDTSGLSLANAGERILPPKAPESHPQPSIDHLSLED